MGISGGRAGERLIIRSGLRLNDGQGGTRENKGYSGLQVNTKWGPFSKLYLSHLPGRRKEAGLGMSSTRRSLKGSHFVYGIVWGETLRPVLPWGLPETFGEVSM